IRDNLQSVQEKIAAAAKRSKRNIRDITVVAVSKLQPVAKIEAAIQCGITDFGENYPEQAVEKIHHFAGNKQIRWHMIGHLQSRKASIVASEFSMFHSLDRLSIAARLENQLEAVNRILPVLLEVNISGEISKAGWDLRTMSFEHWIDEVNQITKLPSLRIQGLMTMPPFDTQPEQSRIYFHQLSELRNRLIKVFPGLELKHLSMGTSQDYEVAVEEGATLVRIGTAILGHRQ
ncbi:MAG TPA: YggS family pyridoxal phosphate-dependent enzyme, partial [Anaerolineaceae bacterium]|nr:YggS family pyridoxal phosphate-dependent enzyme [Anaerolineaceae bacterium]